VILNKSKKFEEILKSNKGLHLTCYLSKTTSSGTVVDQLKQQLEDVAELLKPILNEKQIQRFLKPLQALVRNPGLFDKLGSHIGVYRTSKSFRILSVPIEIEPGSVVATSFHVKPILQWLQSDPNFLLVGLANGAAHIGYGDQTQFRLLEPVEIENLNQRIQDLTKFDQPLMFLAGDDSEIKKLRETLQYPNIYSSKTYSFFTPQHSGAIVMSIRLELRQRISQKMKSAMAEFEVADDLNLTRKNIFQITKMAVLGRVKKLIVAGDLRIFGKIDKLTGGLSLHPFELDHEDDDILDDLAQTVLENGGEVVVVGHEQIPNKRVALAIVHENQLSYQTQAINY
jgi:hypothetical protein